MIFTIKQRERPVKSGTTTERKTHFKALVSFQIVKIVVAQGQWKRKNIMVQRAVFGLKPFSEKRAAVSEREPIFERASPEYPMAMIGRAISFAGSEKIKPQRTFPSRPKSLAKGLSTAAKISSIFLPPKEKYEHSQRIIPAGTETKTALPRILRVLSKTERTITFLNFGRR